MVVRAERVVNVQASPAAIWEFIADPERRATLISDVQEYEVVADGRVRWHVSLPIPLIDRTIPIETEETVRDPPNRVEFVGRSKAMRVVGEHVIAAENGTTRMTNTFTVDGKLPGVERYFKRRIEGEFDTLERELFAYLEERSES